MLSFHPNTSKTAALECLNRQLFKINSVFCTFSITDICSISQKAEQDRIMKVMDDTLHIIKTHQVRKLSE